ncbi:MAG TPA: mechanosensitive ion channel family protein, partial [Chloroflexi bacterium]|nr:mechanosensitive ion channel family protein [Chloroflexota bacterium]
GRLWFAGMQPLITYLGLLSAGLAIALQGPLSNLAGWGLIAWRKPFVVGDRIQIGINAGDVIDTGFFKFTLLEIGNWVEADQSTGRILQVPNGKVFTETVANYTLGFEYIWHELPILITFESNWEEAESVLQDIIERHTASIAKEAEERTRRATEKYMIYFSKLTPIVYVKVVENGVLLTIRYFCNPRRRRSTEHAIWKDILRAFDAQPDIEFAYPTQRFYFPKNETQGHSITQQAKKSDQADSVVVEE